MVYGIKNSGRFAFVDCIGVCLRGRREEEKRER